MVPLMPCETIDSVEAPIVIFAVVDTIVVDPRVAFTISVILEAARKQCHNETIRHPL